MKHPTAHCQQKKAILIAIENQNSWTDGQKALYPTFVNIGEKMAVEGSDLLFPIRLKAKRNVTFGLKAADGILVDKNLNMRKF